MKANIVSYGGQYRMKANIVWAMFICRVTRTLYHRTPPHTEGEKASLSKVTFSAGNKSANLSLRQTRSKRLN